MSLRRKSKNRSSDRIRSAIGRTQLVRNWVEALETRQFLSVSATPLRPSHVVLVAEEDRFANAIGDTTNFPFVNQLAASSLLLANQQGLNTAAQGGEMNYLGLYSGSTQGVTDNAPDLTFTGPNIAQSLNSTTGLSFAGFTESLPADGSQVTQASGTQNGFTISDLYSRDYNPMAMFSNAGPGISNAAVNRTFTDFQTIASSSGGYASLPTVSLVIPNNLDNTHGSNGPDPWAGDPSYYSFFRQNADAWLQSNMGPYIQWAKTHNSLFIVLGDEGDRNNNFANGTQAIVAGDPRLVVPGTVSTQVNVYNILRTVEDMYGLTQLGNSATASDLPTNSLGQLQAPDTQAPSVPGTPTLMLSTQTSATISWSASTDNIGVIGYNIYRNGSLAGTVNGTTTSFTDNGLAANASYSYTVAAFDAYQNQSAVSGALTVSTQDLTPPTTPGTPTLSSATETTATISWAPSSDNVGVAGYKIFRNGTLAGSVNGTTTTFKDTGLTVNSSYSYTVAAFDAAQNLSAVSGALSVTTPDQTPPTVAGTPTLTAATETTVAIAWAASTDNVGVTGYKIFRNGILAGTVNGTTTTFKDAGLIVNTHYAYTIVAFDAAQNQSAASGALNVTTPDLTPPTPPGTPTLTTATETTATIAWAPSTDNVGVAGYNIFRGGKLIGSVGGTVTTFKDTGLTVNTTYSYTVVAFDAAQNLSTPSGALTVATPDLTPPTTPGIPTLTTDTETTVTIAWAASTDNVGVAGYNVYRGGNLVGTVGGAVTTFKDTGLTVNTTYSYSVVAFDAAQNASTASAALTVTTPDLTPPTTPGTPTLTIATETTVTIAWAASTDNVGVAGYNVYRGSQLAGSVGGAVTIFKDTGLTVNTTYSYTVVAFDAAQNQSAASGALTVTPPDQTPPTTPGTPTLTTATETTVTIAWAASTDNVGVAGYNIYRGSQLAGSVGGAVTIFKDTGLTVHTTYAYTVVAFDAAKNLSPASGALTVTTPDKTPPSAPGTPTLTAATETTVTIAWAASTDNVGVAAYNIYRNGTLAGSIGGAVTTFTDAGLTVNTAYAYAVVALDAAQNPSPASGTLNVTTPDQTPPTAPGTPTLTSLIGTTATISWAPATDNVGVAGYTIYRNAASIGSVNGVTTTFADPNVASGGSYSYTVVAFDAAGNQSAPTSALLVGAPDTTPPTAPGTPTLSSATETTAAIGWAASTDNVGVTGYTIYRNGSQIGSVNGSTTAFKDTGLTVNTQYSYTVVAFDAAQNQSLPSGALSVTTPDLTPPTTPGTPTLTTATETNLTIAWAASTDNVGVAGYNIYRNGKLAGSVNGATTSFADSGLTVNTQYAYTVVAFDAAQNQSAPSGALTATTPDLTPPTTPGTPTLATATETTATIAWTASTDNVGVAGYNIYRGGKLAGSVGGAVTTFKDTGLTVNTIYSYTVVAFDAARNASTASAALTVTTPDQTPPTTPGTPTLTTATETTVTIAWAPSTDNVGVAGYNIYRGGKLAGSVSGAVTAFKDTGLTVNTTYSYAVVAFDAAQNASTASAAFTVTTPDLTPPTTPGTPTLTTATETTATIAWAASTDNVGVAGYNIYRGGKLIGSVGSAVTAFKDTGLTVATTYSYTVVAFDAAKNQSPASGALAVTTPDLTPPAVPGTPTLTSSTATSATIAWAPSTDNVGVAGYKIYRGGVLIGSVNVSTTTYTDTGLTTGAYSYTVTAFDAAQNQSAASAALSVTLGADTIPPTVPGTPTLVSAMDTTVTIAWSASTDNVGVTGYNIYRNGVLAGTVSGTTTTYKDTGLTVVTSYSYTVAAFDAQKNLSAKSAALTVKTTPDQTPPTAPTNLILVKKTPTVTTISWTASTDNVGVQGYDIYRNGVDINWVGKGITTYTDTATLSANATYTVVAWDGAYNLSPMSAPLIVAPGTGGTGLSGTYYNSTNLTNPVTTRIDSTVNFNWGSAAPVSGTTSEKFSVEWTGQVQAQTNETYTFYTATTGGVRVWVNGVLIINDWTAHGSTTDTGTISLLANQKYSIKVDYYDSGSLAACSLSWSTPTITKAVIPTSALFKS